MTITTNTQLPALTQLPSTYLIELNNFGAISLSGEEQSKYLQGQVTCDVNNSTEQSLLVGAHCDAKGKVFSVFRLINRSAAHLLLQPKTSIDSSLNALKKFAVFAKVTIEEVKDLTFIALVGEQASVLLQREFSQVPDTLNPVVQINSTSLVYISGEQPRYIIIDDPAAITSLVTSLALPMFSQKVWDLLEITQGFPILTASTSGHYVPQMLNLQAINGISFTKGCYLGQETVARMQYLGKNKRALFSLHSQLEQDLQEDDVIQKQLGENWRKAGDILAYYQADDGNCYLQAILANDADQPTMRIAAQVASVVTKQALPYTLDTSK
ncbi:tRNA-modifying protein [Colwellia sp. MT41]|uniref:tRNA-modifying protein YgfZ n=1 Tax=Colwellia marinimaniae TaxID=1513592 RepID=A0ABQ0MU52_9GAMM|nr:MULTISPECIES: tRNA-modifying protein YgfZ [Colwellia]ALO35724.1 tRNA-modifying protein [Colwellia sp. MT41]GAW95880.1 tRNA-modifying protein YgfZ [Colwellia marinimaniae]